MKKLRTPEQNLTLLFSYIADAYRASDAKTEGAIQLHLTHDGETFDYYAHAGEELTFSAGVVDKPTASLSASLFHWLDLAAGRLNPILGAVSGKLQFDGDTSFFSEVISGGSSDVDLSEYQDAATPFEIDPVAHWQRPQNVLVINGSPRKTRGYTHFYLEPFVEGLRSSGATVDYIHLGDHQITLCTGCWNCWISGSGQCILEDDMVELANRFDACNMLVLAFPLYVDGMPARMKGFLERLTQQYYPYMIAGTHKSRHPRRKPKDRSLVLFSTSGFPELEQFDAVRAHVHAWAHSAHLPVVAELLRPGGMNLYSNPLHYELLIEILGALRRAGVQVIDEGRIDRKSLKSISQSPDSVDEFHDYANGFWRDTIQAGETAY